MPNRNPSRARRWLQALAIALFPVATACSTPPTEPIQGELAAVTRNREILLTNRTSSPIFTKIIGRNIVPLVDWIACADPLRCVALEPGGTRAEPYPGAFNGVAEKEAVVYWWGAMRRRDGTWRPDSIRSKVVRL